MFGKLPLPLASGGQLPACWSADLEAVAMSVLPKSLCSIFPRGVHGLLLHPQGHHQTLGLPDGCQGGQLPANHAAPMPAPPLRRTQAPQCPPGFDRVGDHTAHPAHHSAPASLFPTDCQSLPVILLLKTQHKLALETWEHITCYHSLSPTSLPTLSPDSLCWPSSPCCT